MICDVCKGPMKPLFTGHFCPNDCDRPAVKAARLNKEIEEIQGILAKPRIWAPLYGGFIPPTAPATPTRNAYIPKNNECRDGMCRAVGNNVYNTADMTTTPATWYNHYECSLCSKTWKVRANTATGGVVVVH